MDELSWINYLHAELESKKRFLLMEEVQSLFIPVIENQELEDAWKQIKNHALDASVGRDAPNFLRSIEEVYIDYEELLKRLILFVKYVQELADEKISAPFLADAVGIILKNAFMEQRRKSYEQRSTKQIIEDALSEIGVRITKEIVEALHSVVMHIESVPFDRRNATIQRDTIDNLRNDIDSLIERIDGINNHIRKIIEKNMIFDFGEFTLKDESEFYHG